MIKQHGGPPIGSNLTASEAAPSTLVIGCGFLGGHIARGLALRGAPVRVLSHSFAAQAIEVLDDRALIAGDARDEDLVLRTLRDIDEVIYCVGGLQPESAEASPDVDAALLLDPLRVVLGALARRPSIGITFLSSGGAIYGNPRRVPVDERHGARPIGAYGRVRLAAERMIEQAHHRSGTAARILRCSNVYGENQPLKRGQGAVGVFVDNVSRGEPINVFGRGEAVRDYLYVGDLVDVVCQLAGRRRKFDVINVGSGEGTSITELITLVEEALGRQAIRRELPARPFDVQRVILDVTKLRSLIPFAPRSLAVGVGQLVEPSRLSSLT
jgi:UDP-glucose 4-epimerase